MIDHVDFRLVVLLRPTNAPVHPRIRLRSLHPDHQPIGYAQWRYHRISSQSISTLYRRRRCPQQSIQYIVEQQSGRWGWWFLSSGEFFFFFQFQIFFIDETSSETMEINLIEKFSEMDSESNRSRLTEMRKWRTSPVRRSHEHHPPAARSLQQVKDHQRQLHQHQPPRCLTNRLRESRQSAGRRTPRLPKTSAQDVSSPRRLTKATRSTSLAGTAKRRIP